MDAICSSENRLAFNGLHGVISQKIAFFITTAVRILNPRNHDSYKFSSHESNNFNTVARNWLAVLSEEVENAEPVNSYISQLNTTGNGTSSNRNYSKFETPFQLANSSTNSLY
jgi:hypothetical protein